MKARRIDSNDNWEEIEYVQLKDSYIITKADQMEFDVPVNGASTEEQHWQDVRERAAIAAMQGSLANCYLDSISNCTTALPCSSIAKQSVLYADALIEELKKENN